ncbi:MAG TPA: hypothetical protein PK736_02730 [Bacteroidia bacterium]|nr:hypothetical protein [Bacteroidia bacterium]
MKLVINDMFGCIINSQEMLNERQKLNVTNYAQSIYYMHVYVNGIDCEVHRFTVIK